MLQRRLFRARIGKRAYQRWRHLSPTIFCLCLPGRAMPPDAAAPPFFARRAAPSRCGNHGSIAICRHANARHVRTFAARRRRVAQFYVVSVAGMASHRRPPPCSCSESTANAYEGQGEQKAHRRVRPEVLAGIQEIAAANRIRSAQWRTPPRSPPCSTPPTPPCRHVYFAASFSDIFTEPFR